MKKSIINLLAIFAFSVVDAQPLPAYKAYFPLNGNIKDSSGNTSGAKKSGTVYTTDRNGVAGHAIKFNGNNVDYVDLNDSFSSRSISISFWMNPDSVIATVNPVIVLSNLANITQFTGTGMEIYFYANRKIEVLVGNVSNPPSSLKRFATKSSIPFNKWTHFAFVIDSMQTIKLFVNCKRDTTYSMIGLPTFSPSKYKMHIGARALPHYENPYTGKMDDVRIFNKVLTNNQVTGLYKAYPNILNVSTCNSYVYKGKTYTSSMVRNDTLTSFYGCDSIVSLNLKINKSVGATTSITACDRYVFKGKTIINSGTYYDTLTNYLGCDSLLTYTIKINKSNSSTYSHTACNSYFFNARTVITSGIYRDTLKNILGCDSFITLNLTVNKSNSGSKSVTACNTFFFNGANRISSGIYLDTLTNMKGCDSFLTLNLTINKSNAGNFSASACNSYNFNGGKITSSGTYYDTLINYFGCDSFLTLNLKIYQPSSSSRTITSCDNYLFGGIVRTTSGTYKDTLTNAHGCDSVITLNLTINKVNTSVIQSANILTAIESGAVYQWVDCNKGFSIIPLETKQSFVAKANGSYAVILGKNNCKDTSSCFAVTTLGLSQQNLKTEIRVYPNPNDGEITVELGETVQIAEILISNVMGQMVYENSVNQKQIKISIDGEPGLYFMTVIYADGSRNTIKLMKKY